MITALWRSMRREPAAVAAYVVMLIVVVTWLLLSAAPSLTTITISLGQKLPLVMVTIGAMLVIVSRGIDLSIGAVVALVNVLIAKGSESGSLVLWLALAILAAALVGAVNGALVAYVELPPLVATLATGSVVTGTALYILPQPGGSVPAWFSLIPLTLAGPVPLALILMVAIPLVLWYPLRRSRYGNALYAAGGDVQSAYSSGVPVKRTIGTAYLLSSIFAGIGGVFLTMNAGAGDANIGGPFTLNSIAAAVLGGALLAGGRGTVSGAVAGALTLSFLSNLLFAAGLNGYWQYVVSGVVLILAVALPYLLSRTRRKVIVA